MKRYYPIYLVNTVIFFKTKLIEQKIFSYNDNIMIILEKLISKMSNSELNFDKILSFIKFNNTYKIKTLFVNNKNFCYYILLNKNNKNIFIPVMLSKYNENKEHKYKYEFFNRNVCDLDFKNLLTFIQDYNDYIIEKSIVNIHDNNISNAFKKEDIYNIIELNSNTKKKIFNYMNKNKIDEYLINKEIIIINKWLLLSNFIKMNKDISNTDFNNLKSNKVIGFSWNNMNFYINDISFNNALKLKNTKMQQILYDPNIVNNIIQNNKKELCSKISNEKVLYNIYNTNLYKLFLNEFITFLNKEKNYKLRGIIKKNILKYINSNINELYKILEPIIIDDIDIQKVKNSINDYIHIHNNKKLLIDHIDDNYYNFDNVIYNKLKQLNYSQVYKELYKLSENFIIVKEITNKNFKFSNIYMACSGVDNNSFCSNKKLVISKKKLKDIITILSSDILNPVKNKWILNGILDKNYINMFKFIKRNDETITMTFK